MREARQAPQGALNPGVVVCVPRLLEEVEDRGGGGGFVEDGANEIGALGRRVLQCVREGGDDDSRFADTPWSGGACDGLEA